MFKKISLLLSTLLVAPAVVFASAQGYNPSTALTKVCAGEGSCNGTKGKTGDFSIDKIFQLILTVAQILTYFAIGLAVLAMVYGGILMISDSGDQARVGKGKKILTNAVIGLVVAIVAATIVNIVTGIAGADAGAVLNGGTGGGAAR